MGVLRARPVASSFSIVIKMANTQRRMLYTKLWTSEQFGQLTDKAKLLYIGSITLADDDGRLLGNPAYLRGQIFPYDEKLSVTETLQLRNEVEKSGLFSVYEAQNGSKKQEIITHPNWEEYQKIRKDLYKKSQYPSPKNTKTLRNETVTPPLQENTLSQVKLSKDKLISETSSENINLLIKTFETLNPASKKFYGIPTQRKACQDLISTYTFDRVKNIVEKTLPKTNGIPFFPTITTPLQLRDKWVSLESAIRKYQSEKFAIKNKYKIAFK